MAGAIDGEICMTFRKATCLLRLLNALDASTRRTASVWGCSKICFMVWMAASQPACWPGHTPAELQWHAGHQSR